MDYKEPVCLLSLHLKLIPKQPGGSTERFLTETAWLTDNTTLRI